jgi:prepilin-type N-terminal cleavage/methylation domain-containing protein
MAVVAPPGAVMRVLPTTSVSFRAGPHAGRGGFSLIELLVAIGVIAVLAAIAVPRIDLDGYKVSAAVRAVTSSLTYAQRLAVSLQHDVRVAFDSTNSRLRVHEDLDNDNVMDPGERVTYTPLDNGVVFGRGPAPAFTFGANTFSFIGRQTGLPLLVFRRDGSASENGGFYLNATKSVAQGNPSKARAGEIIRSSGRITWYSYGSFAWVRGN